MRIIRHWQPPLETGSVLALGNFDGVHRGHQALIARLQEVSRVHQVPAIVMTFEPQPKEWLQGRGTVMRLMTLAQKCAALRHSGIHTVACLRFSSIATLSPEVFVSEVLVRGFGMRAIVEGSDFRFGAKRAGDIALLQQLGREKGFDVITVPDCTDAGERVSSSHIRDVLRMGQLANAARLLGRPYTMRGCVVHGDQRGRTLGFPTANIRVRPWAMPISGIMAVRVSGAGLVRHPGVASLGIRPMFENPVPLLEVHLFDVDMDLYGQVLSVELCHKLRDEMKFDSLAALVTHMQEDARLAREFLSIA